MGAAAHRGASSGNAAAAAAAARRRMRIRSRISQDRLRDPVRGTDKERVAPKRRVVCHDIGFAVWSNFTEAARRFGQPLLRLFAFLGAGEGNDAQENIPRLQRRMGLARSCQGHWSGR